MTRKKITTEKSINPPIGMDLSSIFPSIEDNPNVVDISEEDREILEEVVRAMEHEAKLYPYIDDYKILVIPESSEPMIIVNESEFEKLQEKALGQRKIR